MRLLLDNNVLVSGLISAAGPPAQLVDAWREGDFELVTSNEQIMRLTDVLSRPHIANLIGREEVKKLLADMKTVASIVEPHQDVTASKDPEDNLILGTAIVGKVDLLVSGDKKHLLPLKEIEGIPIIQPREAVDRIQKNRRGDSARPSD